MTANAVQGEDLLYISDDLPWADAFVYQSLDPLKLRYVKLPSNIPIRQSWQRFKNAKYIVIHWEGRNRRGGAIVEEILDVDSHFDVTNRIIVITTEPTREDVVYFGELGISRIVRLRNNRRFFQDAYKLLQNYILEKNPETQVNAQWRKLLKNIDMSGDDLDEEQIQSLERKLEQLRSIDVIDTSRYLDAKGSILAKRGEYEEAKKHFTQALEHNSHYYRSYSNLIRLHVNNDKLDSAIALCRKMQTLNKDNISRLVAQRLG